MCVQMTRFTGRPLRLASKIARHYDFSLRWLVLVAVLPGFTIALVSQPLGNVADRPTTNRPRVLRWFSGGCAIGPYDRAPASRARPHGNGPPDVAVTPDSPPLVV